ncbi:MAG: carboxypeptidase-like regulatory domain-containing protein [Proteobacteria bacterium]|nr:carboxypeptidase-like regulatory domain-containing protein [Pseudomonadota bacterium]
MHNRAFAYSYSFMLSIALLLPASAQCVTQPDEREEDNSYLTAHVIETSMASMPVEHNFHRIGDEDWVKFYSYGTAGQPYPYSVFITDAGPRCEAEVSVFKGDGTTALTEPVAAAGKGQEVTADFTCTETGAYFIRVRNKNPLVYGRDTQYWLKVRLNISAVPKPVGTGIISGVVTDSQTGRPVNNAVIKSSANIAALPDQAVYVMLHPAGEFTLTATSDGYLPYITSLELRAGEAVTRDIPLVPASGLPTASDCLVEHLYGKNSPEAGVLRQYRAGVLAATPYGIAAIKAYYAASPKLTALCRQHPSLAEFLKKIIACAIIVVKPWADPQVPCRFRSIALHER